MELLKQVVADFWDCTEVIKATRKNEEDRTIKYSFLENKKINEAAIKKCIERATVDITVRTLKAKHSKGAGVLKEIAQKLADQGLRAYIIDWLEQKFSDYKDYDDWHKKACEKALQVIQEYYTNKDGSPVCYGKAQKVVNMTMKTVYCLVCNDNDAFQKYNHLFECCHIPLDTFTLNWYNTHLKTNTPWSNLQEAEYYTISGNIDTMFKKKTVEELYRNYTPLQAEFFIWEEEQLKVLANELEKGLIRFQKSNNLLKLFNINTDIIKNLLQQV